VFLELALAVNQCAIAKIGNHDRGADHDRPNEQHAAKDEIANWTIAAYGQLGNGGQDEFGLSLLATHSCSHKGGRAVAFVSKCCRVRDP
jgi:hypothetical protein